jgi:hypothetical protein
VASHLESVACGEVRLLAVPFGTLMSSKLEGFGISGRVFLAEGLRGLSTSGDSLSGEMFLAREAEGIS